MKKEVKNKGGFFIKGKYHSEGGIPLVVNGSGQSIEVEKDEALIPSEAMQDNRTKVRKGSNLEILNQVNKEVGAKGMSENATEVSVGDAIVCRKSVYDKTKRTYVGTDKQIVSAVNESGGCKKIESGAKAIEPDGSVKQFNKGGGVSEINARWDKKKKSIEELANNIHRLRLNLTRDLKGDNEKSFLTALVISVMMRTGERIGNSFSEQNNHVGVTGFTKNHIKIDGTTVYLNYTGKSGVEHEKEFTDKVLAEYLKKAIKNSPNKYVFCTSDGFRIKGDRVNRYLDEYSVSNKSIRGYSANKWIVDKLEKIDIPDTEKQRRTVFNKVARQVAQKIGHGVPTLKKHYMMPELADNYIFDSEIINVKEAAVFASGGELGAESLEKRVKNRLNDENKITTKDLIEIVGREPNYPNEYIGGLKLQKCFLINYYRLVG
jgi:DNA topoisomerase IB